MCTEVLTGGFIARKQRKIYMSKAKLLNVSNPDAELDQYQVWPLCFWFVFIFFTTRRPKSKIITQELHYQGAIFVGILAQLV